MRAPTQAAPELIYILQLKVIPVAFQKGFVPKLTHASQDPGPSGCSLSTQRSQRNHLQQSIHL